MKHRDFKRPEQGYIYLNFLLNINKYSVAHSLTLGKGKVAEVSNPARVNLAHHELLSVLFGVEALVVPGLALDQVALL